MQLTSWARSAVCGVIGASLWGSAPPPLYQQFDAADTVIVGNAVASHRIWNLFSSPKTHPRAAIDYEPTYTCEITIRVDAVIKAQASQVTAGAKLPVVWYLPTRDCVPKFGASYDVFNREALWLLRNENGAFRVLVDNHFTAYSIENFSADIQRGLAKWGDPRAAMTYLAVKPGVLEPERRYLLSTLPIAIMPLVRMTEYLKVFRSVYLESTDAQRALIVVHVSTIGYCLKEARRIEQSDDRFQDWASGFSFLNPQLERRREETQLADMDEWRTKDGVIKAFGDSKAAEDGLIQLSCRTDARVRRRAKELLSKYFSIDPSTIQCIPCE